MEHARPPRLSLTNLETHETLVAQFNPAELALGLKAVWAKHIIPGMSHTARQFSHTEDLGLSLDLYFAVSAPTALPNNALGSTPRVAPFTLDNRRHAEQFLLALVVPRGGPTIALNSPPTVLIVWPEFLSIEATVNDVRFKYTRFNVQAQPVEFTATLDIEELRTVRYTSADAAAQGFRRGSRAEDF